MANSPPNIIAENSAATPGLWNSIVTQLWQNDLSLSGGTFGTSSNTLTPESGNTIYVGASFLSAQRVSANTTVVAGGAMIAAGANPIALYNGGVTAPAAADPVHILRAAGAPQIRLVRVNTSFAAPSVVGNAESIGLFAWSGYDGTATLALAARINGLATETWSSTAHGTQMQFNTVANGGTVSAVALTLGQDRKATMAGEAVSTLTHTFSAVALFNGEGRFTNPFYGTTAASRLGYTTGSGGTVTQATNRTTGVTINTPTGQITTDNTSLAAEAVAEFTVTNSSCVATDTPILAIASGANGGNTKVYASAVASGFFKITVANDNAAGGTAETGAIVINYAIIHGANA